MKKLTQTFLFLFLALQFPAQAQKVIELNKSRLDVGKRRFNIVQVVDARYDTTRLGIARLGLGNRKEPIILSGSLEPVLYQYFTSKIPAESGLPDVLLRVSRLGLWEEINVGGFEGARVAVDFEFFLRKGEQYASLGDRKFRFTEGLGTNVTKYHDDNLRAALQSAVDYLQDSVDWKKTDALPADMTLEQISQRITPRILTEGQLTAGAYKNFTDFRNNNPRLPIDYEMDGDKRILLIEGKKGKFRKVKPDDRVWGFCDGKDMYINQFGTFYKLEKLPGNLFQFNGVDYDKKLSNMAIGQASFGLIGALIASEMTKANNYIVDWETGSFLQKE